MSAALERSVNGRNPYAGRVLGVIVSRPVTKWDLLGDADRLAYAGSQLRADGAPVPCSGCGAPLVTEADFAQHFVIRDLRLWNVGDCPLVS